METACALHKGSFFTCTLTAMGTILLTLLKKPMLEAVNKMLQDLALSSLTMPFLNSDNTLNVDDHSVAIK